MISDFGTLLLFILAAIVLVSVVLVVARILRPDRPNEEKLTTYESGEDPVGNANVQFNVRYYVVALLFVLFEVELIFLFPWAIVFGNAELIEETNGLWGWFAMIEMTLFVGLLIVGLAYAWVKGYLDWVRPRIESPAVQSPVPSDLYDKINQKYGEKRHDSLPIS